jgi:hypothetical protein
MTHKRKPSTRISETAPPKLLTGGNPQIPKGDGDASVADYIRAMPGWKSGVGRRLDELIMKSVPGVRKAVRWNTPFFGVPGQGWFLAFNCTTNYIKVAFFAGASLHPIPPIASKQPAVRYFHIYETDELDTDTLTGWVRQAANLPGEALF